MKKKNDNKKKVLNFKILSFANINRDNYDDRAAP